MKSKYLITGAAGYVGSMISRALIKEGKNVTVIVRSKNKLDPDIQTEAEVILADMTDRKMIGEIKGRYDYIIHCAAPTKSAYMVSNPAETTDAIVNGTKHMLDLAVRCKAESMVYLSSMEVYGQIQCLDGRRIEEHEQGYIDVADVRSCYPIAKLMAENLCHSYHKEYGVPVKIARLAQVFGTGVKQDDTRIFAQIGKSIRENRDIILHTRGNSMGNYCDINDATEAILFILKVGKNSETYNVVNEKNTMRIREMAELAAEKVARSSIKVVYEISTDNQYGYAANTELKLSGDKLRKLGWEAKISLEDMIRRMLDG